MTQPAAQHRAFVGLGANLGQPLATLAEALRALAALPGTSLAATSHVYRSAPVEAQGPDFYNAVAELHTTLAPQALLAQLQAIEQQHGRQRSYKNAPRTLDLDLLLHGDAVLGTPALTLPHPRMHQRAFVLHPLAELAADMVIPGHGAVHTLLPAVASQVIERLPTPEV